MRLTVVLAVVVLPFVLSSALAEGSSPWKFIGPYVKPVNLIVADRSHTGIFFTVVDNSIFDGNTPPLGQLYRSTDSGANWHKIEQLKTVMQVVVDPVNSAVYAVNKPSVMQNDIWLSSDSGKSFQRISSVGNAQSFRIIPDNTDGNFLYAVSDMLSYLTSDDGGHHWTAWHHPPAGPASCPQVSWGFADLIPSPFEPGGVYALVTPFSEVPCKAVHAVLFKGRNHGTSWKEIQEFPAGDDPVNFYSDAVFPDRAFLYSSQHLWSLQSDSLKLLASNLDGYGFVSFPGHANDLAAIRYYNFPSLTQIVKTTDGGHTWVPIGNGLGGDIRVLQSVGGANEEVLAGASQGIFRSDLAGGWKASGRGLTGRMASVGNDNFVDSRVATSGSMVYGLAWPYLFVRKGPGGSWIDLITKYSLGAQEFSIPCFGVSPANSGHLLLGQQTLHISTDGGRTWQTAEPPGQYCYSVTFDPHDPNTVYMQSVDAVYKSADSGVTFQQLPIHSGRVVVDEHDTSILYIVNYDGIYKSMDSGQTARKRSNGLPQNTCCADITPLPGKDSYLAASFAGGIFRTDNGGDHWTKVSQVHPDTAPEGGMDPYCADSQCQVHQLRAASEVHWFLTNNEGALLETTDGGKNWTLVNTRISPLVVVNDMSDPRLPFFYIATWNGFYVQQ